MEKQSYDISYNDFISNIKELNNFNEDEYQSVKGKLMGKFSGLNNGKSGSSSYFINFIRGMTDKEKQNLFKLPSHVSIQYVKTKELGFKTFGAAINQPELRMEHVALLEIIILAYIQIKNIDQESLMLSGFNLDTNGRIKSSFVNTEFYFGECKGLIKIEKNNFMNTMADSMIKKFKDSVLSPMSKMIDDLVSSNDMNVVDILIPTTITKKDVKGDNKDKNYVIIKFTLKRLIPYFQNFDDEDSDEISISNPYVYTPLQILLKFPDINMFSCFEGEPTFKQSTKALVYDGASSRIKKILTKLDADKISLYQEFLNATESDPQYTKNDEGFTLFLRSKLHNNKQVKNVTPKKSEDVDDTFSKKKKKVEVSDDDEDEDMNITDDESNISDNEDIDNDVSYDKNDSVESDLSEEDNKIVIKQKLNKLKISDDKKKNVVVKKSKK